MTFVAPVPAQVQNGYGPVNADQKTAAFTDQISVTFDHCLANCTQSLSLTADGKA